MNSAGANTRALEYTHHARRTAVVYLVLFVSIPFVIVPLVIDPSTQCTEYPCPSWLLNGACALGGLFMMGALSSLLTNHSWGSYVDTSAKTICCWNGRKTGTQEKSLVQTIPLLDVVSMGVERGDGSPDVVLLKTAGGATFRVGADYIGGSPDTWVSDLIKLQLQIRRAEAPK